MKVFTYIICLLFFATNGFSQEVKETKQDASVQPQAAKINTSSNSVKLNTDTKEVLNQESLKTAEAELKVKAPNTFEYQYLKYTNSPANNKDYVALKNAYKVSTENKELQFEMAKYYELTNDITNKKELSLKLKQSLTLALKEYAYNTLMSVEQNGILITYGKDDTYPIWILQELEGVRTDVKVLNYDLLINDTYRNKQKTALGLKFSKNYTNNIDILKDIAVKNPSKKIYFSLTVSHLVLNQLKNNLYGTGLALKYSEVAFNNITTLKNNWENSFKKEQLLSTQKLTDVDKKIEMNYILSLVQLSNYYKDIKQTKKQNELKEIALAIAKRNGKEVEVNNLFN